MDDGERSRRRRPGPHVARLPDRPGRRGGHVQRQAVDRPATLERPDRRRRRPRSTHARRAGSTSSTRSATPSPPAAPTATTASARSRSRGTATFVRMASRSRSSPRWSSSTASPARCRLGRDRRPERPAVHLRPHDAAVHPRSLQGRGQAARRRLARDQRHRPGSTAEHAFPSAPRAPFFGTITLTLSLDTRAGHRPRRGATAVAPAAGRARPGPAGPAGRRDAREDPPHAQGRRSPARREVARAAAAAQDRQGRRDRHAAAAASCA